MTNPDHQTVVRVSPQTVIDFEDNGDNTVSLVFRDIKGSEVRLIVDSTSVLYRLSKTSDQARDSLKMRPQTPMVWS